MNTIQVVQVNKVVDQAVVLDDNHIDLENNSVVVEPVEEDYQGWVGLG
jgi:hypothetical protein